MSDISKGVHGPSPPKSNPKKLNDTVRYENNIIFAQENVIHTICHKKFDLKLSENPYILDFSWIFNQQQPGSSQL